ncbi:MAG: fused MFS/spermidine synthase, partial [Alphaproteobacteria bacterium]|nr:fused MFS/spermidine synthase [Alphaproteobacteria bacterium]
YRGPFVPFHLTTAEFYRQAKAKLRPGGVVAQNVEPTTLLFLSTFATLKSVFNNVDAYEAQGNVVLVAYDGPALDTAELKARAAKLQAKYKFRYNLSELLAPRTVNVKVENAKVLTDDFAPVEMLKTIERHNQRKAE